jgi:hypothetical protein
MILSRICTFILLFNLIAFTAIGQQDSSSSMSSVSNPPSISRGFKPYVVPSAMIGYGALALFVPPLKNLNHSIQHQVVTNNPNFSTHLDDYLWFVPTAALYGLNAIGIQGKHNFRDRTVIVIMANGIMGVGTAVTKRLTHELRPDGGDYQSFPSGHTASAFTAAEYLYQEYKDTSPWIGISGFAVAGATGVLRIYNNKHYLGDVIAGAGVGIISSKIAYTIYPFVARHLFKNYNFKTVILPTYTQGYPGFAFVKHLN